MGSDPTIVIADALAAATGGVRLAVKLTPKAARNRIEGIGGDAQGKAFLKVSVTAVPENGKANEALIALLAKSWKIGKRSIAITAGFTDRRKTLFIEGDAEALRQRIEEAERTP